MKRYHFIGIGGIGMSALAHILLDKKISVTGSDLNWNTNTQNLAAKGAKIEQGHTATLVQQDSTVVYSSAVKENNPDYQAATHLKCPLMHRSELLHHLMQGYETYAVTGTHGKTTTASLLAYVLKKAQCDPSYALGGLLEGKNGYQGESTHFVFEADESDGSFLRYTPTGAIITNVEAEHLDHFQTEEALQQAFVQFLGQVKEQIFYCGDDPWLKSHVHKGIAYGFTPGCQLQIVHFRQQGWQICFDLLFEGKTYREIVVPLVGRHNALNAAAVFGLCMQLGVDEGLIREALSTFPGVERRCQKKQETHHVLCLDDYAHHPTEIKATLRGIREAIGERRLVVLFQPHRYSRTQDQWKNYLDAFDEADLLLLTDIYGAGEMPREGVTSEALLADIQKHSLLPCRYLPKAQWQEIEQWLYPHDVFVTMGAGDVTSLHVNPSQKYRVALIYGGLSCEHEISVRSSRFVNEVLDSRLYNVKRFYIDKQGLWHLEQEEEGHPLLSDKIAQALNACDLFLPILHGPYGEDGTIQGFFEMLQKPYVGPDWRSAAIAMNKMQSKILAEAQGVLTPKAFVLNHKQWREQRGYWLQRARELTGPLFVKPNHLGSSVGVCKVEHLHELEAAISHAFRFDTDVMVEEGKEQCREIEFAVMGNLDGTSVVVPRPGEKLANGEPVTYEKKYGSNPVKTTLEPQFAPGVLSQGQEAAYKVYQALGVSGMSRVDFLLDPHNRWWFFEINPIPGMQPLSLFPKIWQREGMSYAQVIDHLIVLALHRHRTQKRYFRPSIV